MEALSGRARETWAGEQLLDGQVVAGGVVVTLQRAEWVFVGSWDRRLGCES